MPFTQRSEQPRLGRGHHWTKFELDIVLGLICKGEHLKCPPLIFATKLNEALNGKGNRVDYDADIPVDDVRDLLADIEAQKKGALAFIERQPRPHVMTRTKKRAFERNLPFTGSKEEWVTGRRDQVAAMKETGKLKKDGLESSFINTHGVQIERWVPRTVIQPGRTDTWMAGDSYTHHQTEQRVPFGVVSHGYSGGQTRSGSTFSSSVTSRNLILTCCRLFPDPNVALCHTL